MVAPNIPSFFRPPSFTQNSLKYGTIRACTGVGIGSGADVRGGGECSILRRRARWPVSDVDAMSASLIDSLVVSFRPPHH